MSLLLPDAPPLSITAESIAADLCTSLGAQACVLLLIEEADQPPRFVQAAMAHGAATLWEAADCLAALQGALTLPAPLPVTVLGQEAVAAPLHTGQRQVGAALLAFAPERPAPALDQIAAAAQLAARVAELSRQAEQIAEGMRLREIQISRNLLRGVIDSVPIGLALVDTGGEIRAVNRTLAGRFGTDPAGLVGQYYEAIIGAWEDSPALQTFVTGQPQRLRRSIGGTGRANELVEISSFPIPETGGSPGQVVELWEDITERVALQTQLVRAEKLAAIGQLAASIAHEVGNPLQAIQGFLSLFLEQCAPETPNQNFLQLAEDEIDRIVQVLARLRDLYRPRADVMAPTDLNELIETVLLLTSKQCERARVRVRRELAPDLPPIDLVADQIKQVLLNLVLNAADAMHEGGLLHIQTYLQHDRSGTPVATITVTDTGVGIAPDQLPYLFDGLHTTKERGMGLGLYTSKAIIERHMGRIIAQSTPGEGTTFVITLPIRDSGLAIT
jgi:PAS domain S-box-containing protein